MQTTYIGKYQFDKWEESEGDSIKWYVKLFNNNAKTELNRQQKYYQFKNEKQADNWIKEQSETIQSHLDFKAKRKADKKAFVSPAKLNDILVASWGYNQTNIDYYQVVKVGKKTVAVREIGKKFLGNDYGQDEVMPFLNSFKSEPVVKLVQGDISHPNDYRIKIASYSSAYLWDGKPDRQTDAYSGH